MVFIELEDGARARVVSRGEVDFNSLCAYGTERNPDGITRAGSMLLQLYINLDSGIIYAVIV